METEPLEEKGVEEKGFKGTEENVMEQEGLGEELGCLLYTSPSPRDRQKSRMPSSA